ncbi:MAG: endonuclease domain-containing protein [Clostridia bacterium]|nr:endonuclease domain-containing protein [Clostridia bacterium]
MDKMHNKNLIPNAKELRKNMTPQERHLWYDFLKSLPVTVKRQQVIGKYIVDFYIAKANLVIEIDGSQHYEEKSQKNDAVRDEYLGGFGLKVMRFSNYDINTNFDGVCQMIWHYVFDICKV